MSGRGRPGWDRRERDQAAQGPAEQRTAEQRTGPRGGRDRLSGELRALGRDLRIPPVEAETMVERVLAALVGKPVPEAAPEPGPRPRPELGRGARLRSWARARWWSLAAVLCGLLRCSR